MNFTKQVKNEIISRNNEFAITFSFRYQEKIKI